jgi:hypothetical protein
MTTFSGGWKEGVNLADTHNEPLASALVQGRERKILAFLEYLKAICRQALVASVLEYLRGLQESRRVGRGFFLPTKNTSAIGSLCPDANQSPGGGHQLPFPPCLFYEKKTVAGLCEPVHRFHFELTDCGLTIHGQIMHPSADAGHCRRGR